MSTVETPVVTPAATDRSWTPRQRDAIERRGKSLLVSAAAGSGKTSVLTQRCVDLICDENDPCNVDQLLVVTFTEAAALEMKERITKVMLQRHRTAADPRRTAHQLAMLDRASISTLHGFCARLLRRHFHLLGLDPDFEILDADEASLLKQEVAIELFASRFDADTDGAFSRLIDAYGDGDDLVIIDIIRSIYDTLCSVVDANAWLETARARIEEAAANPMTHSELGRDFIAHLISKIEAVKAQCAEAGSRVKAFGGFDDYVNRLRSNYGTLNEWGTTLKQQGIDALNEMMLSLEFPRLKAVSSTVPNKEQAKDLVDAVKKAMKEGPLSKSLRFTESQWRQGLNDILPFVKTLSALVTEFAEAYTRAKDAQGVLDFSDLEQLTLRVLTEAGPGLRPSAVAREYQTQFKHVLVDEYQDNNAVQDAILQLISRESSADPAAIPNLFFVGDVKQSIYGFRLAEPARFLQRRAAYSNAGDRAEVIDLTDNFRSRAPLLAAINEIFSRLMTRESADLDYDNSQKLVPGQTFGDFVDHDHFTGSPIELHVLPPTAELSDESAEGQELERIERESVLVGQRIVQITGRDGAAEPMHVIDPAGKSAKSRPIKLSDIVILLRSAQYKADQMAAILRRMGIAVYVENRTGYFEAVEVNDMLSLLQVLDNQQQDIPLAAVLRSPLIRFPEVESAMARVRLAYRGRPVVPFHEAMRRYGLEHDDSTADKIRDVEKRIGRWRQIARERPVPELIWTLYEETGYLTYCSGLAQGEQRVANLIELHDRARQFASFRRQGLTRFLAFLEKLKSETELGQATIASESEDVVRIMTVHGSKGLEFPVVIIPDLGQEFNQKNSQGSIILDRAAGIGLKVVDELRRVRYPSLSWTVVRDRIRQQTIAEELRILYVALTRAKEQLILVGTASETDQGKWPAWAQHQGPLPAEVVLSAYTPLDWLGPVAAMADPQNPAIEIFSPSKEEVIAWDVEQKRPPEKSRRQQAIAELKPLALSATEDPQAAVVRQRLGWTYPFLEASMTASAMSVTSLVKSGPAAVPAPVPANPVDPQVTSSGGIPTDRVLKLPAFLSADTPLEATERGTATHVVLEHLDFSKTFDEAGIHQHIDRLVEQRRLTPQQSKVVDIPAILWFLQDDLGQLIHQHAGALQRELPVYYGIPAQQVRPAAVDSDDFVMVRGRIDLMVKLDTGWVIVDYKTDRVEGQALQQRADLYSKQLASYRDAILTITGTPVTSAALVFLTPRVIHRVTF